MAVAITRTENPAGAGTGTTITYNLDTGTPDPGRIVAVAVGTELTAGAISSATIDWGAGAVDMDASINGVIGAVGARMFWKTVPEGTTADVAITFAASQSATTQHVTAYSVTGAQSVALSSNGIGDTDADPISSGALSIPTGGGCIAVCAMATDTTLRTWTGITEDVDDDAGTFRFTTGFSTTGGTPTITVSGGNNEDGALAWVIFTPTVEEVNAVERPLVPPIKVKAGPVAVLALPAARSELYMQPYRTGRR